MEKVNAEKTVCFIECGFVEARESFSEYCNLKETIPFDIMLIMKIVTLKISST